MRRRRRRPQRGEDEVPAAEGSPEKGVLQEGRWPWVRLLRLNQMEDRKLTMALARVVPVERWGEDILSKREEGRESHEWQLCVCGGGMCVCICIWYVCAMWYMLCVLCVCGVVCACVMWYVCCACYVCVCACHGEHEARWPKENSRRQGGAPRVGAKGAD